MDKLKTIAVNAAVIAVIAIIIIWGVTGWRQWRQLTKGEEAHAAGDAINAIAGYEASLHMYTPASPLVERAAGRLWALAGELEQQGEREKALTAYRSLRSSFYAARGFTTPGRGWIERCDAKIAALVPQTQPTGH